MDEARADDSQTGESVEKLISGLESAHAEGKIKGELKERIARIVS
jgi:hypothetical protein